MKKIYMGLICAGISGMSIAQPTITEAEFAPVIGNTFNGDNYDAALVSPGSAGTGVTWSFPSLPSTGAYSVTYLAPSATPYAASFPMATISAGAGSGVYAYQQINSTGVFGLGIATPTTTISYSDPEKLTALPFTYNTNWTDNLYATYTSSGYPAVRSGTVTGLVDGYGTLVLPSGTFTNILRIKVVEDYSDVIDIMGTPYTYEYDFTTYFWVKENVHYPLLTHNTIITTFMSTPTTSYSGVLLNTATIGVEETSASAMNVSVYPNPSTGRNVQLVFDSPVAGDAQVRVIDAAGSVAHTSSYNMVNGFNNIMLDLNGVESGVYIIEVSSDQMKATKRLILQ